MFNRQTVKMETLLETEYDFVNHSGKLQLIIIINHRK